MSTAKKSIKLVPFDAARYLTDDVAVAEYMSAVLEMDDPDLLLLALADIARARGMAQVAKDAGLGRESLYKALAAGAKPRFDTILKVARALGVRLTAEPVATALPTVRLRRAMPMSKARLNNAALNELAQE
jgi:probable addiction module antidote protein